MEKAAFYILSIVIIVSSLFMITRKNPVHSVLWMLLTFFSVAGIFIQLNAEFIAGFFVEYASMKFALFFLAEYANMILTACIATVLFLGGWNGPFLPEIVWFFIKVLFVIFIYLWLESTLPRLRFDQLMALGWKVLIPIALVNIVVTSVIIYIM